MPFMRYVPEWTGFSGAPGYTVLHFNVAEDPSDVSAIAAAVAGFFGDLAALIPTNTTITYPGEMTIHNDGGTLTGATSVNVVPAPTDCTGTAAYSAVSGARVTWETGSIVAGRRIRGRSFLVPLVVTQYSNDGTLTPFCVTSLQAAGTDMIAALTAAGCQLVVWSPTTSTISNVTSCSIPDQATVLRSRRD